MIKKGFTLIELMVVVLIVGLLSGLVIVNVNNSRIAARDAKRMADIGSVAAALASYYADNRVYPNGDYSAMTTTLKNNSNISLTPADPINDATYYYDYQTYPSGCTADCVSYYLRARVENQNNRTVPGGPPYYYVIKNGDVSDNTTLP